MGVYLQLFLIMCTQKYQMSGKVSHFSITDSNPSQQCKDRRQMKNRIEGTSKDWLGGCRQWPTLPCLKIWHRQFCAGNVFLSSTETSLWEWWVAHQSIRLPSAIFVDLCQKLLGGFSLGYVSKRNCRQFCHFPTSYGQNNDTFYMNSYNSWQCITFLNKAEEKTTTMRAFTPLQGFWI